jgi:ubiquinone/menaquinone biosynthesis C-methylase UbiE
MKNNYISPFILFLVLMTLVFGCSGSSDKSNQSPPLSSKPPSEENKPAFNQSSPQDSSSSLNPPIDCPLRRQGINPHDMKPFEDTQKYIDFLERSDRAIWQKPDAVIQEMHLSGTEKIADVGAGSGYFTFRFSQALPQGKVYAIDIEPEMLRHIHHKAMTEGVNNVEVIKSTPDDPKVPAEVDLVFVCDVIHHVKDRELWLRKLAVQMKKGSQLVVIEFKEGDLPQGPPAAVKIPKRKLIDMIIEHNFKLNRDKADLLPYQEFLIFIKL